VQTHRAGKLEKPLAIALDVVTVKEAVASLRYDQAKPELAVNERKGPKILAVEPQQIESIKPWLTTSE